ncbi:MAG: hypothetical protein R3C51_03245 [Parvularculaceae bacterium]
MNKRIVKTIIAALLAPILLAALPVSPSLAAEKSILAGDKEIEDWVREMQAEILFFIATDPRRADEIGDKAVEKANAIWSEDEKWAQRYVLFHGIVAQTNNSLFNLIDVSGQPADFPDKRKFFDTFFSATTDGVSQIEELLTPVTRGANPFSADERDMAEMLGLVTLGRFLCSMPRIASNVPDGMSERGDGHYKTAIKTLRKTGPENIDNIARGIELAGIDMNDIDPSNRKDLVKTLEEQRDLVCGG